eukprot:CAMPEP_0184696222 /NCGR_PEP_ID=MMETSP0313-20130426/3584_1 /TAXON_ID=2792 /ORGANISM="Porphyridium aerugineum, Strain SAG 1380-2" /LENGTH=81 /DNA_ID=CAMNT_0027154803 /DNA_START=208 /DNA_END=453 /DNA_ORIENTATION=-
MTLVSTTLGAAGGIIFQTIAQKLQKHRIMRHPWEMALCIGIGAYLGHKLPEWDAATLKQIEDYRTVALDYAQGKRKHEKVE